MIVFILVVAVIAVIVTKLIKSNRHYTPMAREYYVKVQTSHEMYAKVYVYGLFYNCTYQGSSDLFEEGDLVVVDVKGQLFPGRILEMTSIRPDDIPVSVSIKSIERKLSKTDKGKLSYWSDQIDSFFE